MSRRLELHAKLVGLLGSDNVYFQPPSTITMKYPAIVYRRSQLNTNHADDELYTKQQGYDVTVIDPNPDSEIPHKILTLPMSRFASHFTSDNLNHDVFNVFY